MWVMTTGRSVTQFHPATARGEPAVCKTIQKLATR